MGLLDIIGSIPLVDVPTTRPDPLATPAVTLKDLAIGVKKVHDKYCDIVRDILGESLEEKKKKKLSEGIQYGDIVSVSRDFYDHYGIYVDNSTIIHYTTAEGEPETSSNAKIQETDFKTFLDGSDSYFVLVFPDEYGEPAKVNLLFDSFYPNNDYTHDIELYELKKMMYKIYSPDETIQRARSRLDEKKYKLISNNCEHFAIWCKTGISESHQVNRLEKLFRLDIRY